MPIKQKWCTSKGTSCDSYEQAEELERIEELDTAKANIMDFMANCVDRDGFNITDFMLEMKLATQKAIDFSAAVYTLADKYHIS